MVSTPVETRDEAARVVAYTIDPAHSVVEFTVKHMMFSNVKGRFTKVNGEILFDEADPVRSSVIATIDAASVDTGDPNRDAHLRSPDFFDVGRYPVLTFKSTRVEPTGRPGEYRIVGDLTIRDQTREVVLDTTYLGEGKDPWGNRRIGLSATTTVNRKDFGLHWNAPLEAGGVLVGDQVKINLEIQAVQKA